jgi:flagellar biosynthesis chaperone FliJ
VQRFEFRLERVLKLKKQRQWLAELQLKQARAALDAARAEVAALHELVARSAVALAAGLSGDAAWLTRQQQALRLAPLIERAEGKAREADVKYQKAGAERTQIATEVEALLHLRGEEWREYRLGVLRAQQEQLDEVGMRLWRAGQDGSREAS